MRPVPAEYAALVDQAFAVHLQGFDGGAAPRCASDEPRKAVGPEKMLPPNVAARVKKRDDVAAHGVFGLGSVAFGQVAAVIRQGQVAQFGQAALSFGNDVFDIKRVVREFQLATAILTDALRPLNDSLP
jgi:hypothetical protein